MLHHQKNCSLNILIRRLFYQRLGGDSYVVPTTVYTYRNPNLWQNEEELIWLCENILIETKILEIRQRVDLEYFCSLETILSSSGIIEIKRKRKK